MIFKAGSRIFLPFDFKVYLHSVIAVVNIILKAVMPYYVLAELLIYFELMPYISLFFEPISALLDLPKEASLAIAAGVLFNLYAAIAFAAPVGLSVYDWTVLGLFLGIIHSIPIESTIMKKLGISWSFSVIFRLIMALIAVFLLSLIPSNLLFADPNATASHVLQDLSFSKDASFISFLINTVLNAFILSVEIILLVSTVIFINQFIKGLRFLQQFDHNLSPIIALSSGVLLGITYGSGVLIKEMQSMTRKQILAVTCFLMVAHALIEDPLLFVIFNANIVVLIVLRLVLACCVLVSIYLFYDQFNIRLIKLLKK